jgi:hypothetical protein
LLKGCVFGSSFTLERLSAPASRDDRSTVVVLGGGGIKRFGYGARIPASPDKEDEPPPRIKPSAENGAGRSTFVKSSRVLL